MGLDRKKSKIVESVKNYRKSSVLSEAAIDNLSKDNQSVVNVNIATAVRDSEKRRAVIKDEMKANEKTAKDMLDENERDSHDEIVKKTRAYVKENFSKCFVGKNTLSLTEKAQLEKLVKFSEDNNINYCVSEPCNKKSFCTFSFRLKESLLDEKTYYAPSVIASIATDESITDELGYGVEDDFKKLVRSLLNKVDFDYKDAYSWSKQDMRDLADLTIKENVIYDDDTWKVIKAYCDPRNVNYESAINNFGKLLAYYIGKIKDEFYSAKKSEAPAEESHERKLTEDIGGIGDYRGVKGITMYYWSWGEDPVLEYKDWAADYYQVEDTLWDMYVAEKKEEGIDEKDLDTIHDDDFNKFCQDHRDDIIEIIKTMGDYYNNDGHYQYSEGVKPVKDSDIKVEVTDDKVEDSGYVAKVGSKEIVANTEDELEDRIEKESELKEDVGDVVVFSTYKPSNFAKETYDRIVEANKLEELEFALDGIYPTGITEEQLDALLANDPEYILTLVGIINKSEDEE